MLRIMKNVFVSDFCYCIQTNSHAKTHFILENCILTAHISASLGATTIWPGLINKAQFTYWDKEIQTHQLCILNAKIRMDPVMPWLHSNKKKQP